MAAAATTEPIQYGQYNVPHFSEMVNFSVGQVRIPAAPREIRRSTTAPCRGASAAHGSKPHPSR